MSLALLPLTVALGAQVTAAACDVDLAQRMMAQQPRPDASVEAMLNRCRTAGVQDYRIDLLGGVIARDSARLPEAATLLTRSHELAPRELAPILELAVTYEFQQRPQAASALYLQALDIDPSSRPARLGLARVARQEYRPEEAERIYRALLADDADDREARTGLAMAALQRRRYDEARAGLESLQATYPDDPEVRSGIAALAVGWRHRVDLMAGNEKLSQGRSAHYVAQWEVAPNARDAFRLRYEKNNRELVTFDPIDRSVLPLSSARAGWVHRIPGQYFWEVAYEYRQQDVIQDTRRIELNVGHRLGSKVQAFAGIRQQSPSPLDDRLWHLGMSVPTSGHTYATLIAYYAQPGFGADNRAYVADLTYERERLQITGGVGYGEDPDNVIVHVLGVWPLPHRNAITFGIERRSLGDEVEAVLGWRLEWQ